MNHPATPPPLEPSGQLGHETRDANVVLIALFGGGLALMLVLVLPAMGWMFWNFEGEAERADPVISPLAGSQVPPAPRLETNPGAELARLRRQEDQALANYGWIDRERGIVRLPIDRAIELLAKRGLPEPKDEGKPTSPDSNSDRPRKAEKEPSP